MWLPRLRFTLVPPPSTHSSRSPSWTIFVNYFSSDVQPVFVSLELNGEHGETPTAFPGGVLLFLGLMAFPHNHKVAPVGDFVVSRSICLGNPTPIPTAPLLPSRGEWVSSKSLLDHRFLVLPGHGAGGVARLEVSSPELADPLCGLPHTHWEKPNRLTLSLSPNSLIGLMQTKPQQAFAFESFIKLHPNLNS